MAFIQSLLTFFPNKWPPLSLVQESHSADYEYGTRGRHAKPCRACSDFQTWVNVNNSGSNKNSVKISNKESNHSKECPLDKDELGRNSWSLLHTMAAYYPDKPTKEDQNIMNDFIKGLARFYPCESCASDFRKDILQDPPDTKSRIDLSNWWCRMHNRVNKKLGKPEFDCAKIDERWLDGWKDGSCD